MTERKSDEQNVHNGPLTPELAQGGIGLVIPHNFLNEINMTRENRP